MTYGVWWIGTAPERIPVCQMTYTKRDDRFLRYPDAVEGQQEPPIVLRPSLGLIPLAPERPADFDLGAGYHGCGSMVLLQVGLDEYVVYSKLGGP
jgi:hypothetical protein